MPRYVLLEFESNEAAERFVLKTMDRTLAGAKYKVLGFFAKPRGFCKCGHIPDSQMAKEVTRGSKYGWMIHRKCGRPRRMASQSPRNLLDPDMDDVRKRTAFLDLVGGWAKDRPEMAINRDFPISIPRDETNE